MNADKHSPLQVREATAFMNRQRSGLRMSALQTQSDALMNENTGRDRAEGDALFLLFVWYVVRACLNADKYFPASNARSDCVHEQAAKPAPSAELHGWIENISFDGRQK